MAVASGYVQYFDLLVLKTYQSSLVINFIYEPNKWSKVEFNYWISFRKDISMGVESYTEEMFKSNKEGEKGVI